MDLNKIYCMDCLEGLKQLEDNSVDLVFTDPPYNAGKDYGVYKDNLSDKEYKHWMKQIVRETKRISGNNVCFYVGHKVLNLFWKLLPNAKLIIIHKRATGSYDKNYFYQYFGLLTTKNPIKRIYNLWNDVRVTSEGYYFKETRYPNPGLTSESLTTKVIKSFSNIDNIVCDPFMGTGTTAVVCKKLRRNYIGFELNPEYIEISKKRINKMTEHIGNWLEDV